MSVNNDTDVGQKLNESRSETFPFKNLKITNNDFLNQIKDRTPCSKCSKSRKFFCYTCYIPVAIDRSVGVIPNIELPISIDIIKHKHEIVGKSTAVHAAILAPNYVKVYEYPTIPDYSKEDGVVLIFPSHNSISVQGLFSNNIQSNNLHFPKGHNIGTLLKQKPQECSITDNRICDEINDGSLELPVKKAVFIDSTWNQCRSIYKDEKINSLRCVVLKHRLSQFWRHQKGSPRWYLATIEAIHQFLIEFHINAWGLDETYVGFDNLGLDMSALRNRASNYFEMDVRSVQPYCGQYDDLLFFFSHMYKLIHSIYDHNKLKAYKRPIN